MDIHFRDDRPEAIVSIMVALNENKLAVQFLFKLPIFLDSAFFSAFEDEVAQKENGIAGFYPLVMFANDRFIHFLSRFKRPIAVGNDIKM